MNSAYGIAGRQLQDAQYGATGERALARADYAFAAAEQLTRSRLEAKRFQDRRCPICGSFGCDGC